MWRSRSSRRRRSSSDRNRRHPVVWWHRPFPSPASRSRGSTGRISVWARAPLHDGQGIRGRHPCEPVALARVGAKQGCLPDKGRPREKDRPPGKPGKTPSTLGSRARVDSGHSHAGSAFSRACRPSRARARSPREAAHNDCAPTTRATAAGTVDSAWTASTYRNSV